MAAGFYILFFMISVSSFSPITLLSLYQGKKKSRRDSQLMCLKVLMVKQPFSWV